MEPRGAAGGVKLIGRLVCVVWTALPLYEVLVGVMGGTASRTTARERRELGEHVPRVTRSVCRFRDVCVCGYHQSLASRYSLERERPRANVCSVC